MTKKIDEMFVFVATADDGSEGIMAQMMGDRWVPYVCSDMKNTESLKKLVQEAIKVKKMKVTLVRFSNREVLEVFE